MVGTIKYAKRNFPSCSLRSQFTASQKPPLLFPNAKKLEPATGNQQMGTIFPPLLLISFAIHCLAALPNARIEPGDETIKWEPFFLPLLFISFAIHCLAALPNARIEPGDETIKWEPFFLPLLLISFAIHCLAALPNALVVPYCHSLVSRNCIRYMEPSLYTRQRIWIRSLRSLSTLASLAIQILYPPRRVCADGESHPPARLVIASLRSL